MNVLPPHNPNVPVNGLILEPIVPPIKGRELVHIFGIHHWLQDDANMDEVFRDKLTQITRGLGIPHPLGVPE